MSTTTKFVSRDVTVVQLFDKLNISYPTIDCHFHYSTRFATKCVGCANAILKQFVEINRNQKDECWHPECYMIHKVSWCSVLLVRCQWLTGTEHVFSTVLECKANLKVQSDSSQLDGPFDGERAW